MFNYIWATMKTMKTPQSGVGFHIHNNEFSEYIFYPFPYTETVFTIDLNVWNSVSGPTFNENDIIDFWPNSEILNAFYSEAANPKSTKFLILSNQPTASTIDPDCLVPLLDIRNFPDKKKNYNFLGHDVIDISGLSAIANIGYSKDESFEISNAKIGINSFGLISSFQDSVKFSEMASLFAIEHAPFFPVEVWSTHLDSKN